MRSPFWRRRRWLKWFGIACAIFFAALCIAGYLAARHAEPFLRALIVDRLQDRFHARVELDRFHLSLAQGLRAEGQGLRIWPPAQVAGMAAGSGAAGKPIIQIAEFRFHAPIVFSAGKPVRISRIELRGLIVDIPPRTHFLHAAPAPSSGKMHLAGPPGAALLHFLVETLMCRDAKVILENSDPAKPPLEFDIQSIDVANVSSGGAMSFQARLTNPRPRGMIVTSGKLGPWAQDDPGTTPLEGSYSFQDADLSAFKGISGTLNSAGRYSGTLRELNVQGVTDTPNFALSRFGAALPLHTDFHARVDGTNGDTWLEPVDAVLGQTSLVAEGKVVQLPAATTVPGKPAQSGGREIALTVNVTNGQIADFLRLTSRDGAPLLTGTLHLKTALDIPPGHDPVHERMRLKGAFHLDDARFTNQKIQERIGELSLRGQGKPRDAKSAAAANVLSTMTSSFTMANAVITLPGLKYMVPGVEIDLSGTYEVDGGRLNFNGAARMQATVSQMVGGWKGALLKPADRFFKKQGAGTQIRVHVDGTRTAPHFGVDF